MKEENREEKYGRLLFKQSSELEILISAAIVFAAFTMIDLVQAGLSSILNNNVSNSSPFLVIAVLVSLFLSTLLPLSILVHFVLRFYWLSLVGLKTTFERQRLEKLRYAPRYLEFLSKKDNLDVHIAFIDKLCSSIFAFSFLAVFVFCFTTISISLIIGLFVYVISTFAESWTSDVFNVLLVLFFLACLLSLVDFFSLGILKRIRKRWFIRIYYPINRFIGLITFSYFYRGLYYTFITNVPKRISVVILPLYLLVAVVLLNAGFHESKLYSEDSYASRMGQAAAKSNYYRENFSDRVVLQEPFIKEYYVKEDYLPIYIPITEQLDDALVEGCDSIIAINNRGFHWTTYIKLGFMRKKLPPNFDFDAHARKVTACFKGNIKLLVDDSIYQSEDFRFFEIQDPKKKTLMTTLNLGALPPGNHALRLEFEEAMGLGNYEIPFYKTPR